MKIFLQSSFFRLAVCTKRSENFENPSKKKDRHNKTKKILLQTEWNHGNTSQLFLSAGSGTCSEISFRTLLYLTTPFLSKCALTVLRFQWLRMLGMPPEDYNDISPRMALKTATVLQRNKVYSPQLLLCTYFKLLFIYLLTFISSTAHIKMLQNNVSCNYTFIVTFRINLLSKHVMNNIHPLPYASGTYYS